MTLISHSDCFRMHKHRSRTPHIHGLQIWTVHPDFLLCFHRGKSFSLGWPPTPLTLFGEEISEGLPHVCQVSCELSPSQGIDELHSCLLGSSSWRIVYCDLLGLDLIPASEISVQEIPSVTQNILFSLFKVSPVSASVWWSMLTAYTFVQLLWGLCKF